MTKCSACNRDIGHGQRYCVYHQRALEQLKSHYERWISAYGDRNGSDTNNSSLSWREFLARLLKMDETGQWVKEVIQLEMKMKEEEKKEKKE